MNESIEKILDSDFGTIIINNDDRTILVDYDLKDILPVSADEMKTWLIKINALKLSNQRYWKQYKDYVISAGWYKAIPPGKKEPVEKFEIIIHKQNLSLSDI